MAAAVRAALSPNTWPCNSTAQAPYSQTYSAYSSRFAIMQKSIDSASVCLHKGDSCACLSSIVELFLGFLKEAIDCIIKHTEPKAADLFPIKASITFLVRLCWRKTMIRQSRVMRLLGMVIDRGLMILMPLSNILIDSVLFFINCHMVS